MAKLWSSLLRRPRERHITTIEDYAAALSSFMYNGHTYGVSGGAGVQQTLNGSPAERIGSNLTAYATQAYAGNGVVFACMAVRMLVFSSIRFQYQQLANGRPGRLFGNAALSLVEEPWPGGTTQDLLLRMIQDADLAGNSYWTRRGDELVRLRPDWVDIVLEPRQDRGGVLGYRKIGYLYHENGPQSGSDPIPLLPDEVAHFAPTPDPLATYRGMSWLTPVLREITTDGQMMLHKAKFFENAATPNLAVSLKETVTLEQFKDFMEVLEANHKGVQNAYETMYLGGGADVKVVGADLKQLDFKAVQGAGETRIAAAAGVPPVVVGLSEGMQGSSLNAGNYGQARRRLADVTIHPLWQNAAGSLAPLLPRRSGARFWYDTRDVPFLREDRKDQAEIQLSEASTISMLTREGYTHESAKAAVIANDWDLLEHTGLFSVQLQEPGANLNDTAATSSENPAGGSGDEE
ncbi:phage portal protein [Nocardiopsis gilva YIM 90087]|uniref:Phage portal protein n=1 Tax=Nocardiopsis gilva YIM 90087 TaxID=1235441 RepID=A0A223S056_9ACTN|nr:phage portal protein [Nocardiopsis gilva]ASU81512.1 phage portal protein [Nocardiopsis gilva YIM 90087]